MLKKSSKELNRGEDCVGHFVLFFKLSVIVQLKVMRAILIYTILLNSIVTLTKTMTNPLFYSSCVFDFLYVSKTKHVQTHCCWLMINPESPFLSPYCTHRHVRTLTHTHTCLSIFMRTSTEFYSFSILLKLYSDPHNAELAQCTYSASSFIYTAFWCGSFHVWMKHIIFLPFFFFFKLTPFIASRHDCISLNNLKMYKWK